jgi:hypothetical protein
MQRLGKNFRNNQFIALNDGPSSIYNVLSILKTPDETFKKNY